MIPGQFRRISYLRYGEFRLRWFSNPGLFASTWFRRNCRQISIARSVPRFLYSTKTLSSSYDSQRHSQHFKSNSAWAGELWSHFFSDGYLWKLHLSFMFYNGLICGRFLLWVFLAIHEVLKTIVYSLPQSSFPSALKRDSDFVLTAPTHARFPPLSRIQSSLLTGSRGGARKE